MLEVTAERACLSALLGGGEGAGRAGETFPNFAWACNARMDPQAGAAMDIDCLVSSLDGKELFRCVVWGNARTCVLIHMDMDCLVSSLDGRELFRCRVWATTRACVLRHMDACVRQVVSLGVKELSSCFGACVRMRVQARRAGWRKERRASECGAGHPKTAGSMMKPIDLL